MSKIGPKVTEKYFGTPISDCQSADEPYDPMFKGNKTDDGTLKVGRGSQGGGSKPTPQAGIMKRGSGKLHGSYPSKSQQIRGK